MTAFSSTAYTVNPPTAGHGLAENIKVAAASVAVPNTLAANDTVNLFYLPAGATVRRASLRASPALDSNGSPTLTLDVGDAGNTARLFSQSLAGSSASGDDGVCAFVGLGYQYPVKTAIFATVHAAGATKVAGTISLTVFYTVDGMPS
ncbi:MAG: hypothetical protein ACR2F8_04115 [Caulobacteraceae bacterium]